MKRTPVLVNTGERPRVVAFVCMFMTVSAAAGDYAIVPPHSFHILGAWNPIVYLILKSLLCVIKYLYVLYIWTVAKWDIYFWLYVST
jgi:hypothetical protein